MGSVLSKFHEGVYLGAFRLIAKVAPLGEQGFMTRGRGQEGRAEAAERGVVGNGPSGRLSGTSRNVAISGLPEYVTTQDVKEYLKSFKLAGSVEGEKEIVKMAK